MDTEEHDHAVALISHAPHLVAALMAARLEGAREESVRISGTGIRDLTRIAGGAPELWEDILAANAPAIAEVLAAYAADLDGGGRRAARPRRPRRRGRQARRRRTWPNCCAAATPATRASPASTGRLRPLTRRCRC